MELIKIKVIANAKRNEVIKEPGRLKVRVAAPAVCGKANKALIALLAEYLGVKKSGISIIRGEKSAEKVIWISPGKMR